MTDQLVMNLAALALACSMLAALVEVGRRLRAGKISDVPADRALRAQAQYRWARLAVGIMVAIVWLLAIARSVQVPAPLIEHGLLHEQFARLVYLTTSAALFWLIAFAAGRALLVIAAIVCAIQILVLLLALFGVVWST